MCQEKNLKSGKEKLNQISKSGGQARAENNRGGLRKRGGGGKKCVLERRTEKLGHVTGHKINLKKALANKGNQKQKKMAQKKRPPQKQWTFWVHKRGVKISGKNKT